MRDRRRLPLFAERRPLLTRAGSILTSRRHPAAMAAVGFVLAVAACLLWNTGRTQSPVWYGPLLSAAATLEFGSPLTIDMDQVRRFADLPRHDREEFRFSPSPDAEPYRYNDVGFSYLVYIAKTLVPFAGDHQAIESLQIIAHAMMTAVVIYFLPNVGYRISFLVLYGINPLIIYFTTFPFYYFWQAIPAFALVLVLLRRDENTPLEARWGATPAKRLLSMAQRGAIVGLCALIALCVLARPTILLITLFTFAVAVATMRWKKTIVVGGLIALAIVVSAFVTPERNFWHTAYVGAGAYPNPFGLDQLSDNTGYDLFQRKTGTPISPSLGGNMYDAPVMARYKQVARDAYLDMMRTAPLIFVRNAILNVLQSYSIGYITGAPPWVHYAVAGSGLVMIGALLYSGQYILFLAIGLAAGGFTIYFPPIPAYMFASYILLVIGGLRFLGYMGTTKLAAALSLQPRGSGV